MTHPPHIEIHGTDADTNPCGVVPLGGTRKYTVTGADVGTGIQWASSGSLQVVGPDNDITVEVRGTGLDNRAGLSVRAAEADLSIPVTVAEMRSISAALEPTPSTKGNAVTAGFRAHLQSSDPATTGRSMPPFVSRQRTEDFPVILDDTVLVLLRGDFPPVRLTADASVGKTPIHWEAVRNPADQPDRSAPPSLARDLGDSNELALDSTGSFSVRAWAECTCGTRHADLGVVLLLVLVDVRLRKDRTQVNDGYFSRDARRDHPFDFGADDPSGWRTDTVSGQNAIDLNADFDLLSGGHDGRLYLTDEGSAVNGGWYNTAIAPQDTGHELSATYASGHCVRSMLVLHPHDPAVSPTFTSTTTAPQEIDYPVCDCNDGIAHPRELRLSGAVTTMMEVDDAPGWRWRATAEDMPNDPLGLFHPQHPDEPLVQFDYDFDFIAGFCAWSESAPWIIGVACTISWNIRAGWTVTPPATPRSSRDWTARASSRPVVAMGGTTAFTPIRPANAAGIEVWAPGTVQHMAKKTY